MADTNYPYASTPKVTPKGGEVKILIIGILVQAYWRPEALLWNKNNPAKNRSYPGSIRQLYDSGDS